MLGAVLALVGCSQRGPLVATPTGPSAATDLKTDAILFSDGCVLELSGDGLEYEKRAHPMGPPASGRKWRVALPSGRLAAFWARVDGLGVWTWTTRSAHEWETWGKVLAPWMDAAGS